MTGVAGFFLMGILLYAPGPGVILFVEMNLGLLALGEPNENCCEVTMSAIWS